MNEQTAIETVRQVLTSDVPTLDAAGHAAERERALGPAPSAGRHRPGALRAGSRVRRRHRRWPATIRIAVPAAAIAIALTIAIALGGGGGSTLVPSPLEVPSAEAAAILDRAASHLAAGSPLRGTQARVIREDMLQLIADSGKHGTSYHYVIPRTMESGYDALGNSFYEEMPDGRPRFADAAAEAAYVRALGAYVPIPPKPRIEWHHGPDGADPNVLNLSAREVLALPVEPAALKARLLAQSPSLRSQDEPTDLVDLATRLLTNGPTPPAVEAALARLLATLPGVHRIGTATIGGHRADVLSFPGAMRLAFDQGTGQLLEEIDLLPHRTKGYPDVAAGSVVDVISYSTGVAPTIDTPINVHRVAPVDGPRP
jgi:hypothetical protein